MIVDGRELVADEETRVLDLDPGPGNGRNSGPTFFSQADGDLLLVYTKYVSDGNHDHDPSVISVRRSSDGGRTWADDDRVLIEPEGAMNVMCPSVVRVPDGKVAVEYMRKTANGDGSVACTPWVRFSDDELQTLSEPFPLTTSAGYHVVNSDRMVQLSTGRLVLPVSSHRHSVARAAADGQNLRFANPGLIFYLLSDDHGQTWCESPGSYYRCFPDGQGLQEPGVVELSDGRLWSWSRTGWNEGQRCGHQWQSFSDDGGLTWTEPEPSVFVSPYSPLSMKRIPTTGDLLAVWNDHSGRFPTPSYDLHRECRDWERHRTPLSCAISDDDGASWRSHRVLEDAADHGFCYTAIHFVDDAVLLAYCAGGTSTNSVLDRLRIRRIPIDWLYATA